MRESEDEDAPESIEIVDEFKKNNYDAAIKMLSDLKNCWVAMK